MAISTSVRLMPGRRDWGLVTGDWVTGDWEAATSHGALALGGEDAPARARAYNTRPAIWPTVLRMPAELGVLCDMENFFLENSLPLARQC
jgi:hypothetical protein